MSPSASLALYLHIPFCTTKCTYCAFNTYINHTHLIDAFVDALQKEITTVAQNNIYDEVGTIYFGGGTPTLLSVAHFEAILKTITQEFLLEADPEISTEANPNDLTIEYLRQLRSLGVNRLSIGMQSADQNDLDLFARHHTLQTVVDAVGRARNAGYNNVNLDLIYGAPLQTLHRWEYTLQKTLELAPEHISLYALGLEEGTAMHAWVNHAHLPAPDDDLAADMYDLATEMLVGAGLEQYEISNWAKPGFECRHNLQYWRNLPYLGFGPGAHGFAGGVRYDTILTPQRYIKAITQNDAHYAFPRSPATDHAAALSQSDEIAETLLMSLRLTQEGVSRSVFRERFGQDVLDTYGAAFARFEKLGLLEITSEQVRLTDHGRLLSNVIFRELV